MKKLLCALGSVLYSVIAGYLIWLLFFFLTDWSMSFGLLGISIIIALGFTLVGGFIAVLVNLIIAPLAMMLAVSPNARWLSILSMGLFGFSTIIMPWRAVVWANAYNIIMAVLLSIMALVMFGVYIVTIYNIKEFAEND